MNMKRWQPVVIVMIPLIICIGMAGALAAFSQRSLQCVSAQASDLVDQNDSVPVYLPGVLRNFVGAVTLLMPSGQEQSYEDGFAAFESATGIDVVFIGADQFVDELRQRALSGNLPDLALIPQPGLLGDLAAQGHTVDLYDWFTPEYLAQQYEQSLLDLATFDGQVAGVWYTANIKSLVYYPKAEFDAAGYQVPQTWTELLNLSDQMVVDGRTPWCIGIQSGVASGWVGTDWVEDILLRTASPADYDGWIRGDLPFTSPEIRSAFETMADIWFHDDYVLGGRAAITSTNFWEAPTPLFDDPPGCWLHRQASFIPVYFPQGSLHGVDYDFFYLPPIDTQYGNPVLGAGEVVGVFTDNPSVRIVVEYLTTAESARWYIENGTGLSPHKDVEISWYPNDEQRGYAQILMNADVFRFDASDLMPGEVGSGTFWTGILDYVNGADLDTVLQAIDASWP